MDDNFSVIIDYKNKRMENVNTQTYSFDEYTSMLSLEIKKVITDIEDAFYNMQNEKLKEDWTKESLQYFIKIRHKLLDYANAIERLPSKLQYAGLPCGTMSSSDFIAAIVNKYNFKPE